MAWLYKRGGSKFWWLGWRTPDRQLHFKSTKCDVEAEAKKQLAAVESLFAAQRSGAALEAVYESLSQRTRPRVTLKAALSSWMTECESSTAPDTLTRYRTLADAFALHLGAGDTGPMLDAVTSDHIRQFQDSRRASRSASTMNLERQLLSTFFCRGIKNGLLISNPVAAVAKAKASREEKGRKRAFTLDELRTIFSKCPDDFWRYLVLAGFYTGQRLGDLVCLRWGAVDLQENILRLTQGKTGRGVKVPLRPALCSMLAALRVTAGKVKPDDFVWPAHAERYQRIGVSVFARQFYEILAECGLTPPRKRGKKASGGPRTMSPISFHSLRHTFVSILKATGGTQAVAKELAGHGSDAISDLYTHNSPETLAKAIAALPEVTL